MRWHPGSEPEIESYRDPLTPLREPEDEQRTMRRASGLRCSKAWSIICSQTCRWASFFPQASTRGRCARWRENALTDAYFGPSPSRLTSTPARRATRRPLRVRLHSSYWASHQVVTDNSRGDLPPRACGPVRSAMDQPTIDGMNTYFVSRATAQAGFKVAISGLGGDELFGGYPSFRRCLPSGAGSIGFPSGLGRATRRTREPPFRVSPRRSTPACSNTAPTTAAHICSAGACSCRGNCPACSARNWPRTAGTLDVIDLEADTTGIVDPTTRSPRSKWVYLRNRLLRDADWAGMATRSKFECRWSTSKCSLNWQRFAARWVGRAAWSKHDLASAPTQPLPAEIIALAEDRIQCAGAGMAPVRDRQWWRPTLSGAGPP